MILIKTNLYYIYILIKKGKENNMKKELKKKKNIIVDVKKVQLYGSAETGVPNVCTCDKCVCDKCNC